jgi:hypothetical protein
MSLPGVPLDDLLAFALIVALFGFGLGVVMVTVRSGAAMRRHELGEPPTAIPAVRPARIEHEPFRRN